MKQLQLPPAPQLSAGLQRGINWIMPCYFVTGLVGSVFLGIILLRDHGYITFEPYDYYVTQHVLFMGLGLLMGYGWIVGIILILLYRRNWSVITPAAMLVAVKVLSVVSGVLARLGASQPWIGSIEYLTIHLYCVAALLFGGGWLIRNLVTPK